MYEHTYTQIPRTISSAVVSIFAFGRAAVTRSSTSLPPYVTTSPNGGLLLLCRRLWRRASGDALWHAPRRVLDNVRVLAVLDLLHADLAFDQLVHVRDHDGALDVHQREGGRRVALSADAMEKWRSRVGEYKEDEDTEERLSGEAGYE